MDSPPPPAQGARMSDIRHLDRGGRRLAHRRIEGHGPAVLFLPGYMSDMEGSKALALEAWCQRQERSFLRFDYGGCGAAPATSKRRALPTGATTPSR